MTRKLLYLVSHPIQYQAPLLQRIAQVPEFSLRVIFENIPSVETQFDPGFERDILWDIPLRDGYDNITLAETDLAREIADCDVLWLHGWQTPAMRHALKIARKLGKPTLMRGENCDLAMPDGAGIRGVLKRWYLRKIFQRCTAFLTIGSQNEKYYRARGVSPERLFLTPYAIDNGRFADQAAAARPNRTKLKESLGLSADRPVILFAGKLMTRKCPDLLVRALQKTDFKGPSPQLVFVGDGEMLVTLQSLAPDAHFLGFRNQQELPALYDMADLFVLPSLREPWGLAVNEAMACSTAVIVSDQVGSAVDLVSDDCGAVFQAADEDGLSNALARCLEKSEAMGEAAKSNIDMWGFDQDIAGLTAAIGFVTKRGGNG